MAIITEKISFWQLCFVHYYFRLIPSWNLEETIDQEVDRFDGICRKGRNTASCLILVMYMDNLTAATKKITERFFYKHYYCRHCYIPQK